MKRKILVSFFFVSAVGEVRAQDKPAQSAEELAKKLANPVTNLISLPLQNNTDYGIGTYNGSGNTLNIQPVIPIKLSPKLNLIARFILPFIDQRDITGPDTKKTGLSDLSATARITLQAPTLEKTVNEIFSKYQKLIYHQLNQST